MLFALEKSFSNIRSVTLDDMQWKSKKRKITSFNQTDIAISDT